MLFVSHSLIKTVEVVSHSLIKTVEAIVNLFMHILIVKPARPVCSYTTDLELSEDTVWNLYNMQQKLYS